MEAAPPSKPPDSSVSSVSAEAPSPARQDHPAALKKQVKHSAGDDQRREQHSSLSPAASTAKGKMALANGIAAAAAAAPGRGRPQDAPRANASLPQDSFGNIAYHSVYHADTLTSHESEGKGKRVLPGVVPWELRVNDQQICEYFFFLATRRFWFLIENAARLTFIGMLVPAALIMANLPHTPFGSVINTLAGVVVGGGTCVGESSLVFWRCLKAAVLWLPLATACVALKLNRHIALWFIVYTVVLFFMAFFTEKTTRRISLLLYNISMVMLLRGEESLMAPVRLMVDWYLGVLFALASTLVPFPRLATKQSAAVILKMFKNTSTCFEGILCCFRAASSMERNMSMVHVRYLMRSFDELIDSYDAYDTFTFNEIFFFDTYEHNEVRQEKFALLLKLKMNLRTMERVINIVQERPQMLNQSERCLMFHRHLLAPVEMASRSVEELLAHLSAAKTYKDLQQLGFFFEGVGHAVKNLQDVFDKAQRILFYENKELLFSTVDRLEEFVPLMTFFVFSIANFWSALREYETFIQRRKPARRWVVLLHVLHNAVIKPLSDSAALVQQLFTKHDEASVGTLVEGAKVSVAMLISVIFFYYVDSQFLLITGPTIIAFVSGTNSVEAFKASTARMTGTLMGTVIGFFASSLCATKLQKIITLCTVTFIMTFFRPGKRYGVICTYCNFVALTFIAQSHQTADKAIGFIQQNTFSIFIYCFISIAIFPVSPNKVLMAKRLELMHRISLTVRQLTQLLVEAAARYSGHAGLSNSSFPPFASVPQHPKPLGMGVAEPFKAEWAATTCVPAPTAVSLQLDSVVAIPGMHTGRLNPTSSTSLGAASDGGIMPRAFIAALVDTTMEHIFKEIFVTLKLMKSTTSLVPLAADEISIVPREYPHRASGDVHIALNRLCALVYTMACCFKAMREKAYYTMDTLHIMRNLAPVAVDITQCLERFVYILEFYAYKPSSGMSSELVKLATLFRTLCTELGARMEHDVLVVIRKTAREKGITGSGLSTDGEFSLFNTSTQYWGSAIPDRSSSSSSLNVSSRNESRASLRLQSRAAGSGLSHRPAPPSLDNVTQHARQLRNEVHRKLLRHHRRGRHYLTLPETGRARQRSQWRHYMPSIAAAAKRTARQRGWKRHRCQWHRSAAHSDPLLPNGEAPPSQSSARSFVLKSVDSDEELTCLSESFALPVTVQDAEGLHGFVLSLEMFGLEMSKVLYGLEEMLQSQ